MRCERLSGWQPSRSSSTRYLLAVGLGENAHPDGRNGLGVAGIRKSRRQQHAQLRPAPANLFGQLGSRHAGHDDVGKQDVGGFACKDGEAGGAVGRFQNAIAELGELAHGDLAQRCIVLDDEHRLAAASDVGGLR
jgi:hypothetical protein